jgi:hypothetical protein
MKIKSNLNLLRVSMFMLLFMSINDTSYANETEFKTHIDKEYFFKIDIPTNWNNLFAEKDYSFLRLSSVNPSNEQAFFLYAIKADTKIDLKLLAGRSDELFSGLGQYFPENKKIINYISKPQKYIRTYKNDKYTTKLYIKSDYNFGYILMYKSSNNNFQYFDEITKSFTSDISYWYKLKTWFKGGGIFKWIIGIIISLLVIGLLYLIGKSGQTLSKGIEMKKELKKIKKTAIQNGNTINEKWKLYNKKSNQSIFIPLICVILFYSLMFFFSSIKIFAVSLIGFVVFMLGFFNVFFVPSSNANDYFSEL